MKYTCADKDCKNPNCIQCAKQKAYVEGLNVSLRAIKAIEEAKVLTVVNAFDANSRPTYGLDYEGGHLSLSSLDLKKIIEFIIARETL